MVAKSGTLIPSQTPARLMELARGIVTQDYLVADGSNDWMTSLILIAPALAELKNIGCILVPVRPHERGYWLNGHVPALTIECQPVNKGDTRKLQVLVNRMNDALWPTEP